MVPDSDKTLAVEAFLPCAEIDDVYFDKPYYLAPSDPNGEEVFTLIREGLAAQKVAAIARTVLFRRMRTVLIRAYEDGLVATTLNFDYEVRPAGDAFKAIPERKIDSEMLELARHIIQTKMGEFDPSAFDDRYEAVLEELVKAKIEGRTQPPQGQQRNRAVLLTMGSGRYSPPRSGTSELKRCRPTFNSTCDITSEQKLNLA